MAKKLKIETNLDRILEYLEKNKEKKIKYFGWEERDEEYTAFLVRTSPKRIKKWNLLGRYFEETFIKNAEMYL